MVTVDTSWTKQKNILPSAFANLKPGGAVISLIKPHYEAGKGKLKVEEVEQVLQVVKEDIKNVGEKIEVLVESPILGERGKNREFLVLITCV